MKKTEQTIHPVYTDGTAPLYFITSSHGVRAHCLGERRELEQIRDKLNALLERDLHDGVLDENDERLDAWLTVEQAAKMAEMSARSIRRACRLGYIENAKPSPWRMSRHAFRRWLHHKPVHTTGPK